MGKGSPIRALIVLAIGVAASAAVISSASRSPKAGEQFNRANQWAGRGTSQTQYFQKTGKARLHWEADSGGSPNSLQVEVVDIQGNLLSTPVIAEGSGSGTNGIGGEAGFVLLRMTAGPQVTWKVVLEDVRQAP